MGASQSAPPNKPGQAASSRQGCEPITAKKTEATSPDSIHSVMSTDDPYEDPNPTERARKRARKDSEIVDLSDRRNTSHNVADVAVLHPPFSCEVFVSGASCRLPESNSLEEFWHNLIEGRDMVTEDDRRWPPGLHGLPRRNGKLKDVSHFDAEFFRVNPAQAHAMDPQLRLLFEVAYEAIIDAGYNPLELKGTQTGVFVGNMFMEALEASSNDSKSRHVGYGLTGACDSMLSNYLSFFFDFKGPSVTVNTACSASLTAFDLAAKSLLCGQCEFAIAAGTNLLLKPGTALHMLRLGMLAKDGSCKAFDASANGYVRSEGIVAVLLTIKENARRAYAQVLNTMSSCDGHKVEGIAYPSSESQRELIWGVHYEVGLVPSEMFYVEAHGTGTKAGDYEECKALDEAIALSKYRLKNELIQNEDDVGERELVPLLTGSVKSNMGHCEGASGLAGLVKVVLSYRHGLIPPNLHYKSPNPRIPGLIENRLSVVTTPTPLPPNARIGINNFGFGGSITHVILRGCERSSRMPRKGDVVSKVLTAEVVMDDVTMIVPLVSRTEQGLQQLMDFAAMYRNDKEALTLLSHSFGHAPPDTHPHRGYVLWNKNELVTSSVTTPPQANISKQQVWFVFDGMGSQWSGIGKDLLMYEIFSDTIKRCYEALPPDVNNLITGDQSEMAENYDLVVDEIAAVCAVSVGLVELLKAVGIEPDGLIGHSLGELILCYADGALSLEQCMQLAYWRIKCVIEANIPKGAMATVGLPWEEVKARCPDNVWPVCSNSLHNVTISGEIKAVERFVAELTQEKIFTKTVKCSGLPYHSPLMQPAVNDKTFEILRGIVKNPKPKSKKWVVSALPLDEDPETVVCSADFHIRSLVTPVHFYEALQKIPPGSVIVEVGAHALLQAILKRSLTSGFTIIPLQDWKEKDQSVVFMRALGICHNAGVSLNPLKVVKSVDLPVGPRTPSIGHLVSWEHIEEWHVPKPEDFVFHSSIPMSVSELYITKNIRIDPQNSILIGELSLSDYKLDGSILIPPSFLVISVWRMLAENRGQTLSDFPISLTDVTFQKLVAINSNDPTDLTVTLSTVSGHFEVILNCSQLISSGTVSSNSHPDDQNYTTSTCSSDEIGSPSEGRFSKYPKDDIYKELSLRGYQFGSSYKVLHEIFMDNHGLQFTMHGNISLRNTSSISTEAALLCLIDGLFQLTVLQSCERLPVAGSCTVIKGFRELTVDPILILSYISPLTRLSIASSYDSESQSHTCWMDGVSLEEAKFVKQPRAALSPEPQIEKYNFHPYFQGSAKEKQLKLDTQSSLSTMMEIVLENVSSKEVALLQILDEKNLPLDSNLGDVMCQIIKGCSVKDIKHDLLIVGTIPKLETLEHKVTGHITYVESISHESVQNTYDVIFTPSVSSVHPLLDHNKLIPGGFVLAALKPMELGEDKLTPDLPTCQMLSPKLVAERPFEIAVDSQSTSGSNTTGNNQALSLQLYRLVDVDLLGEEGSTSIVRVSPASGSFSWISKLKKLLTAKDGPKRIYCVSKLWKEYPSGLIGMMNCLRLEGYANRLRCIQLDDVQWEELLNNHTHIWDHIKEADMIMNVVRDGQVGSFVHTPLSSLQSDYENTSNSVSQLSVDIKEFTCSPEKTYIITGGLGGFGLEVAEWLVERGAEYIILTSRTGTLTPYRKRKLQILKAKGVKECTISTLDVSDENQAVALINTAVQLSPGGIGGVFHLAVVLRDCLFENQNAKRFKSVLAPKSTGALNIDKALREFSSLNPSYDSPLFVVFSSASAGLGNAGQTNYAFANSSMERLCEMRNSDGLQSVAIQWGAIGEVGILHTIMGGRDIESLAGTKPQPIHSCLSCLDTILSKNHECATISCYIPALRGPIVSKRSHIESLDTTSVAVCSKKDVKFSICRVLGIRDPARLSLDSKLNELGLDSLMNFEIRGLLEKDFGVVVDSTDLQKMSLREVTEATLQTEGRIESTASRVCVSVGGEVTGSTESVRVEGVSSATSLSTQSSFVSVSKSDE